jgi:hypothetical protein
VLIDGGLNNLLTSRTSLTAVSGLAVIGTSGNDTVVNNGLAVGNFRLGGGNNALLNSLGATLVTINSIDLRDGIGSTGSFTNSGNLLMGLSADRYPIDLLRGATFPARISADPTTDPLYGTGVISRVALDGNVALTATSHSVWDVAFGPYASDKFDVTGNAAVNGTADVTVTWLQDNRPVTLFATGGSAIDNGLKVRDTLALDFRVETAPNAINLAFTSAFGQPFLNTNERALGASMDSALLAGNSAGIGRLLTLLGNLTTGQEALYKSFMAELDPGLFVAPALIQFDAARNFGAGVLGCGEALRNVSGPCLWGKAAGARYERDTDRGDYRFEQDGGSRLRMGVELPFGTGWKVGAAFGYDDLGELRYDQDRATAGGEAVHGGVALAKGFGANGAGQASLALSGGTQSVDMSRRQAVFVNGIGTSHSRTNYVGGTAELGYSFGSAALYARPSISGSLFRQSHEDFVEKGLDGLGITGLRHKESIASVSPKMTLGAQLGGIALLSVNGGGVFHDKSQLTAPVRLIGANPAADPAMIRTLFDKRAFTGGLNLSLSNRGKVAVDFGYQGEFGKSVTSHDAHFTLKAKF